jgi:mannonate dehydratase
VDTALWDIKGKTAGLPVYQLLGGRSRDGVLVYSHASGSDTAALLDDVERFLGLGYKAVRAQAAVPDVGGTYGVRKGKLYEPAASALPDEQPWDTEAYLRFAPTYLEAVRERFGFGFHLLHDVHHRLTPMEAARFGKRVEDVGLLWMEDPTPAENQEGFRLIRQHTTTPVAVGEVLTSIWDVQHLITEQLIDYVRTTVAHAGGITHLRRIFDLAALYQVRTGSHGATDLSPVSLSANVHLDLAVPNFGIQEYMGHPEEAAEVFRGGVTFTDGMLHPAEEPGLGVEYDERAAARFPYEPRYLPVARRLDGSVHDW